MLPTYSNIQPGSDLPPETRWDKFWSWACDHMDVISVTSFLFLFVVFIITMISITPKCPKCNVFVDRNDNYCTNCGHMLRNVK